MAHANKGMCPVRVIVPSTEEVTDEKNNEQLTAKNTLFVHVTKNYKELF